MRELGAHPDDGAPVWLKTGHYGPFVAHLRHYASVPREILAGALTLERALALLAAAPAAAARLRPTDHGSRRLAGSGHAIARTQNPQLFSAIRLSLQPSRPPYRLISDFLTSARIR